MSIKKIILFMAMTPMLAFGDLLYFWINNDEIAYPNLAIQDNVPLSIYVDTGVGQTKLDVNKAKGNGYWKYNNGSYVYVKENLTTSDLGHDEAMYTSSGDLRSVYVVNTRNVKISNTDNVELTFSLELDMANGTSYTAKILEYEIWNDRAWPYKNHVCNGVTFYASSPEPTSCILLLVGLSLLTLRRKTNI